MSDVADTEAEFKRKDSEYFALIGRTVAHGREIAQVVAYQAIRGPEYLFTLQYTDGREVGSPREQFYVLPTQPELAEWLREIFSTDADPEGTTWDTAAECLLALLNGEVAS